MLKAHSADTDTDIRRSSVFDIETGSPGGFKQQRSPHSLLAQKGRGGPNHARWILRLYSPSVPLVLGTPCRRGSFSTAARSDRAAHLKIASLM